jgi:hypothetical protein
MRAFRVRLFSLADQTMDSAMVIVSALCTTAISTQKMMMMTSVADYQYLHYHFRGAPKVRARNQDHHDHKIYFL